ncbi:hypothetical protein GDO78_022466 [Eleutherodactylus coqui]|uniref:Uncharacterized protein n=1 Tax=Eleutherodactylus coqui TaxID=57060 RepID=A0A8J6E763_ELECQ|nr:hypothetical protein GDO78_022466 [Eleutherodactylus coqui]
MHQRADVGHNVGIVVYSATSVTARVLSRRRVEVSVMEEFISTLQASEERTRGSRRNSQEVRKSMQILLCRIKDKGNANTSADDY